MVIEQADREVIEKYEFTTAKVDLLQLKKIYDKYNVKPYNCCLCTSLRCKIFRKVFDEWHNNNK
jgi:hypothetical protein